MKTRSISYLTIIRPLNAAMAFIGVTLGFWLSDAAAPLTRLVLLVIAAICALGYGNVINDVQDAEGDLINHPNRPLPRREMTKQQAGVFAAILAAASVSVAWAVSLNHLLATALPLLFLTLYTLFLKNTPLLGNIVISLLVAYTLVFGALGSPNARIVIVPALLAFLLNLCREIVKDMQDTPGDRATGVHTTARLSTAFLRITLTLLGVIFLPLALLPWLFGDTGYFYLLFYLVVVIPLHLFWLYRMVVTYRTEKLGNVSTLIKIEMIGGLGALALDKIAGTLL